MDNNVLNNCSNIVDNNNIECFIQYLCKENYRKSIFAKINTEVYKYIIEDFTHTLDKYTANDSYPIRRSTYVINSVQDKLDNGNITYMLNISGVFINSKYYDIVSILSYINIKQSNNRIIVNIKIVYNLAFGDKIIKEVRYTAKPNLYLIEEEIIKFIDNTLKCLVLNNI